MYDNLLASNASVRKARDFMLASKFEDERYPAKSDRDISDDEYEQAMTNNV